MTADTVAILAPILLAAAAILVVNRLNFRASANVREAVVSPVVYAIAGALIGIATGMICLADQEGRVTIEKGVTVVVAGGVLGVLAGTCAQGAYLRTSRYRVVVFLFTLMLLAGSAGAPIGWIVGAIDAGGASRHEWNSDYASALKQLSVNRMIWGTLIGAGVGVLLGLPEVLFRRREVT